MFCVFRVDSGDLGFRVFRFRAYSYVGFRVFRV